MKKLILFAFLTFSLTVLAQENLTEGVIIQKQTFSSSNAALNGQLAMLGDMQTTTYFKDNKSRTELSNPMAGDVTTIIDNDKKEMIAIMDNPQIGKKYTLKELNVSEDDLKNITVTPSEETKDVLGYTCKKYDIVLTKQGVESKLIMYTTDKITALSDQTASLGGKVKGFPMSIEIQAEQAGMDITINMEVAEIKKEAVDDSKFDMTIPEGYEKMDSLK